MKRISIRWPGLFPVFLVLLMSTTSVTLAQTSTSDDGPTELWRKNREEGLKKEGGWLSVAGLHWLQEGKNSIGTGASNDYVLPAGSAPENVGVITLRQRKAMFAITPGVVVTVNGKAVNEAGLKLDSSGKPDRVQVGGLTFILIERGKRIGIRLWDINAPGRRNFTGLKWYPINAAYRVTAEFTPYPTPKKVSITNILGDIEEATIPGYLTFTLDGQECRLEPQSEGKDLFINFRDKTSGKTTYPPGRFLYAEKLPNGQIILDFNRAYNPPCSFTAFATCPLPPPQNFLKVAVPAGELKYHSSAEEFVPVGQTMEYASDIAAMVKADEAHPPAKGGILFYGSSIIREWSQLTEQFAPLPTLNRGFGGARTWETLHYADQIALPYEPKLIIYYAGSNDINVGEKPEAILERYRQFSDRVTERLPNTTVLYLAIFRAPQKKDRWDIVDAANRLIRDYSLKTHHRGFIDANSVVFDTSGNPRMDLYREDGLHFKDTTYIALARYLQPIIEEAWKAKAGP